MRVSLKSILGLVAMSMVACGGGEDVAPTAPAVPGASAAPETPEPTPAPAAPAATADELTEQFGIFVAKHGSAQNPGSRRSPLLTISDAIEKAKLEKKRVYICDGTYAEALVLADGVSLLAGLDCSGDVWKLTEKRSKLVAPTSPAVRGENIVTPTRLDHLEIVAPDAGTAGTNSVGLFALDSNAITFANGSIRAGNAGAGANGVAPDPWREIKYEDLPRLRGTPEQPDVNPGPGAEPGRRPICDNLTEQLESNSGGAGGSTGLYTRSTAAAAWAAVRNVELNFSYEAGPGSPGAGVDALAGVPGESSKGGRFTEAGYVVGSGVAGTSGTPGRGGAGGAGLAPARANGGTGQWRGTAGAAGGAGGCPGLAGTAGQGGGASLGIFALRSPIRLERVQVTSGRGGAGGKGSLGSAPTNGDAGGRDCVGSECAQFPQPAYVSGPGQRGGLAGGSGAGAGGPSHGIAYRDGAPVPTESTFVAGAGGSGVEQETRETRVIAASPPGASAPTTTF